MPPISPERSRLWPDMARMVDRLLSRKLTATLIRTPTTPPRNPMQELSSKNIVRMLPSSHPSTFMTPISRVRS